MYIAESGSLETFHIGPFSNLSRSIQMLRLVLVSSTTSHHRHANDLPMGHHSRYRDEEDACEVRLYLQLCPHFASLPCKWKTLGGSAGHTQGEDNAKFVIAHGQRRRCRFQVDGALFIRVWKHIAERY